MSAAWVLTLALLAVPAVLLFATSGCGLDPIDVRYGDPDVPPQKAEKPKPPQKLDPIPGSPLPLPPVTYRQLVLGTQGLVGYWRLGETSTAQPAANSFAQGTMDGAYVGAGIALGQNGISKTNDPNTAAAFLGIGGYVNVPAHQWLSTSSVSVEFWVQWRQDLVGWPVLVGRYEQHLADNRITRGYRVRTTTTDRRLDGSVKAHIEATFGGMVDPLIAELPVLSQEWHYVVMSYSKPANVAQLWVDGVLQDSSTGVYDAMNSRPLRFAGNQDALVTTFAGGLDEVAIYNVSLKQPDIAGHFQAAEL